VRFADTSFWIALRYARDAHHEDARARWRERGLVIATTNHVVGETWTYVRSRLDAAVAVAFLDAVTTSPRVTIHHVDEQTEAEAWAWLRRHAERPYSFVDATSFALMRRLRIRDALTYDADFATAGLSIG
jgi:predicted nucleic acid-binding protein